MSLKNYTKINGNYEPINVIASNLIRCTVCKGQYSQQNIRQHVQSHVPQKLQSQDQHIKRPIKLAGLLIDQENTDNSVKTFHPDELPVSQSDRNNPEVISTRLPKILGGIDVEDPNDTRDCIQNDSQLSGLGQASLYPENQQQEQIRKNLNLFGSSFQRNKQNYHYYEHGHSGQRGFNGGILNERRSHIRQYRQDQNQQQYIVKKGQKEKTVKNVVSYNFEKEKVKVPKEKINTISHIRRQDTESVDPHHTAYPLPVGTGRGKHQCPKCTGFYCDYCKSTIPPQYRQYDDGKVNKECEKWYRDVYSKYNNKEHVHYQRQ